MNVEFYFLVVVGLAKSCFEVNSYVRLKRLLFDKRCWAALGFPSHCVNYCKNYWPRLRWWRKLFNKEKWVCSGKHCMCFGCAHCGPDVQRCINNDSKAFGFVSHVYLESYSGGKIISQY